MEIIVRGQAAPRTFKGEPIRDENGTEVFPAVNVHYRVKPLEDEDRAPIAESVNMTVDDFAALADEKRWPTSAILWRAIAKHVVVVVESVTNGDGSTVPIRDEAGQDLPQSDPRRVQAVIKGIPGFALAASIEAQGLSVEVQQGNSGSALG